LTGVNYYKIAMKYLFDPFNLLKINKYETIQIKQDLFELIELSKLYYEKECE